VGRAEVARLKDLNIKMKHDVAQLDEQLQLANAELETARARIEDLEVQLAAASAAAPASAAAQEPEPAKNTVIDDKEQVAEADPAAAAHEPLAVARTNPFLALGDIGLGEVESQLVALAGAHGYVLVFGEDSAEGAPSARTQIVENAAAALTAAGTTVVLHKLDISEMETDSAFVVLGEDGSQVRAGWRVPCPPPCFCVPTRVRAGSRTFCVESAAVRGCGSGGCSDSRVAAARGQQRHKNPRNA
jgi:hypothetical protein